MSVVVGIDPDSRKYGIAVYREGVLTNLENLKLPQLVNFLDSEPVDLYVIEDVLDFGGMYERNRRPGAQGNRIAQNVGQCKQAQIHLIEFLTYLNHPFIVRAPCKDNWAKNKLFFERATGWTGNSNEDTRSAAYFGFLYKDKTS